MLIDSFTIQKTDFRGVAMEELPYFKFFPAEWITGDITLCSLSAQGLFTNIMSFYWIKKCSITLAQLKQRFSNNLEELKELENQKIFKIKEEKNEEKKVEIKFLNLQYKVLSRQKKAKQKAGRQGGKASRKDSKQSLSDAKADPKHIEKKRKDIENKRKDISIEEQAGAILERLNIVTGCNYCDKELIIKNLLEGKSFEGHMKIIEVKRQDPDFNKNPAWMKPSTLFGKRFDEYQNQNVDMFKNQNSDRISTQQVDSVDESLEYLEKQRKEREK
jgi:uncharacterized phage protein (TIGR02220 family)